MRPQLGRGHDRDRRLVCRLDDNGGPDAGLVCFAPACGTKAPSIAGLQALKSTARSQQIVSARFAELQKGLSHFAADHMHSRVVSARRAAAIAEETRERRSPANLEGTIVDVLVRGLRRDGRTRQRTRFR